MPDQNSFDAGLAAASAGGALANAVASRAPDGWIRKLGEGVCGALVGIFCGPAAADGLNLANRHWQTAVAFGVGAGGAILMTAAMDVLKSQTFRSWLEKRFQV